MKEHARAIAQSASDSSHAQNSLREYLQALILRSLHECEAFRSLALRGDTALRFLYGLPRYSEDLVFSVIAKTIYSGKEWLAQIRHDLSLAGFGPHVTFLLRHHDLPTLLAGKLVAIMSQRRPRGRDWYDLMWCLTQRPAIPLNMIHLQHAMNQARHIPQRNARMWRNILRGKLVRLDMAAAAADARPFLEHPRDAVLLTRDNLFRMLAEH